MQVILNSSCNQKVMRCNKTTHLRSDKHKLLTEFIKRELADPVKEYSAPNRHTLPRNDKRRYEVREDHMRTMIPKLTGKPILANHKGESIGHCLQSWENNTKWMADVELDDWILSAWSEFAISNEHINILFRDEKESIQSKMNTHRSNHRHNLIDRFIISTTKLPTILEGLFVHDGVAHCLVVVRKKKQRERQRWS